MPRACLSAVLALAACLSGQSPADPDFSIEGTRPKEQRTDYPAHTDLKELAIGAEYLVRSFSAGNTTFVTADYLVVEVAVYPAPVEPQPVAHGHFTLRINGRKSALLPQAPSFVAASLKYADWEQRPGLQVGAGTPGGGIVIGAPPLAGRFPGDPRARRLPAPPRAPAPEDRSGIEREERPRAEDYVVRVSLPEGEFKGPVAGYLYFPFRDKAKSIRRVELEYRGPAGKATLPLLLP